MLHTTLIDMKMFNTLMSMCGDNACRANVHNATHYKKCIEVNGPLWANSGFNYENFDGDFKKLFKAVQSWEINLKVIEKQMLNAAVHMVQQLPEMAKNLPTASPEQAFYNHMAGIHEKIIPGVLGSTRH